MSIRLRRGLSTDRMSVILEEGELTLDTDTGLLYKGDGVTMGGIPVIPSDNVKLSTDAFSSKEARFFSTLGLPDSVNQSIPWNVTASGVNTVDLQEDPELGQVIRANDDGSGIVNITQSLNLDDWTNLLNNGGVFGGQLRMDTDRGSFGGYMGIQMTGATNPTATSGNRRFGIIFERSDNHTGDFVRFFSPEDSSNATVLDGVNEPVTVMYDEWCEIEVLLEPNEAGDDFNPAKVYVNGVLLNWTISLLGHTAGVNNAVVLGSGSTSGTQRISYWTNFGVTILEESPVKRLDPALFEADSVSFTVPSVTRKDFTLIFPNDIPPRAIGSTISYSLNNKNGKVFLQNEDPTDVKVLFDGAATKEFDVAKSTVIASTDITGTNQYSIIQSFREDVFNPESLWVDQLRANQVSADESIELNGNPVSTRTLVEQKAFRKSLSSSKGLPQNQGWIETVSGSATIDLNTMLVDLTPIINQASSTLPPELSDELIKDRQVVTISDNVTDGLAQYGNPLNSAVIENMIEFGGTMWGLSQLNETNGSGGFMLILNINGPDNPYAGDQRYALIITQSGDYVSIQPQNGTAVVFNESAAVTIGKSDWFSWQITLPAVASDATAMPDATLKLNGVEVFTFSIVNSGVGQSEFVLTSASVGSANRITNHLVTRLQTFSEGPDVTVTSDQAKANTLILKTPLVTGDYSFMFASDIQGSQVADTIVLDIENVGDVRLYNEDAANPKIFFNSLPELLVTNVLATNAIYINTEDDENEFIRQGDDYEADKANDKDLDLGTGVLTTADIDLPDDLTGTQIETSILNIAPQITDNPRRTILVQTRDASPQTGEIIFEPANGLVYFDGTDWRSVQTGNIV